MAVVLSGVWRSTADKRINREIYSELKQCPNAFGEYPGSDPYKTVSLKIKELKTKNRRENHD